VTTITLGCAWAAADELLIEHGAARHMLIALDQAEDLFAPGIDAEELAHFAELVIVAFDGPVRLVLTVRSEYDNELSFLAPVKVTTFRLGTLERPMLRSAIEEPARMCPFTGGVEPGRLSTG
jgi:Novel STAND NTPase 1